MRFLASKKNKNFKLIFSGLAVFIILLLIFGYPARASISDNFTPPYFAQISGVFDKIKSFLFPAVAPVQQPAVSPVKEARPIQPVAEPPIQPSLIIRSSSPEKEITKIREIIERKEIAVPADLASFKALVLSSIQNFQTSILNTVDSSYSKLNSKVSNLTSNQGAALGIFSLSNKIDQLNNLIITNGLTVQSGTITVSAGNISVTGNISASGNITATGNLAVTGSSSLNGVSYAWPSADGTSG